MIFLDETQDCFRERQTLLDPCPVIEADGNNHYLVILDFQR